MVLLYFYVNYTFPDDILSFDTPSCDAALVNYVFFRFIFQIETTPIDELLIN
jgi:hypothetical protein